MAKRKTPESRVVKQAGTFKRCGGFGGCGGTGFVGTLPHARCKGTGMRSA